MNQRQPTSVSETPRRVGRPRLALGDRRLVEVWTTGTSERSIQTALYAMEAAKVINAAITDGRARRSPSGNQLQVLGELGRALRAGKSEDQILELWDICMGLFQEEPVRVQDVVRNLRQWRLGKTPGPMVEWHMGQGADHSFR
jgi:hypothetical protein